MSALGKAAAALRAEAAALKALPRCSEGAKCPAAGPLQGGASDGPAAEKCKSAGPVKCEPKTQEKTK